MECSIGIWQNLHDLTEQSSFNLELRISVMTLLICLCIRVNIFQNHVLAKHHVHEKANTISLIGQTSF